MKTKPFLLSVSAAVMLIPFFVSAQEAKKYQLKLERPLKAGIKTREVLTGTIESSQRITQGDEVIKSETSDLKVELSGDQEVLEVSERGNVKKLSFKVTKFTIKDGDNPAEEPFRPGTVITGSGTAEGRERYEAHGNEVKGPAAKVLTELISMTGIRKKEMDEDVAYGTDEPRAAGSEWKVDAQKFFGAFPDDSPLALKPEGVAGKAKLADIKIVNGIECCQFQMDIAMKADSIKKMPPGFKLDKVDLKLIGEKMVPVDTTLPVPSEKMDQRMEFSGTIPNPSGELKMVFFDRIVKERTSTPLK